jgi:hypothetical protein
MLVATLVLTADGLIVLRHHGPRLAALGIRWVTAIFMLVSARLLARPLTVAGSGREPGLTYSAVRWWGDRAYLPGGAPWRRPGRAVVMCVPDECAGAAGQDAAQDRPFSLVAMTGYIIAE